MNSIIVKESSMIKYRYKTPYFNKEIIEPAFWLADRIKYNSNSEKDSIIYTNSSHESNIIGIREYRGKDVPYIEGILVNGQFNTYFQSEIVRRIMNKSVYDKVFGGFWIPSPIAHIKSNVNDYKLRPDVKRDYYLLAGIISPLISRIVLDENNQVESLCLTTLCNITTKLVVKIQSLFKDIYDKEMILDTNVMVSYIKKNSYFNEIHIRHDKFNLTDDTDTLLGKFVQFLRFLYRRPLINYKCIHIPSGIITATKASQDAYIQGMGLVYAVSTKFHNEVRCGVVKSPIRTMETSLRYLLEMRNEPYNIKYYDGDYRCTFTATNHFGKLIRKIMERKPTDDSVFIEICKEDMTPSEPCIEIFYDGDYIEVDGLVIPS